MTVSGRTIRAVLLCVSTVCLLNSKVGAVRDSQGSCRTFVQGFYDWYVPKTQFAEQQKYKGPTLNQALKYRRSAFDPSLVRQIEGAQAEADREGEVFLDFDPILNSQDPAQRYEVRHITQKGQSCWADVYGNYATSGNDGGVPDVVAEVLHSGGRWVFTNFHYPNSRHQDNESLVSMLKRILRARPAK